MAYAFRLLVLFVGLSSLKVWAAPVSGDATYETLHVVGSSKDKFSQVYQMGMKQGYFYYEELTKLLLPQFKGIAYGAGGAGCPSQKTLVNFHSFDCVTFVETYWAISRTLYEYHSGKAQKSADPFLVFSRNLNRIRYFGGENCGIEHRIHYFTQQMEELDRAGYVFNVGMANGLPFKKKINYISQNGDRYGDIATTAQNKSYESILSTTPRFYYPTHHRNFYYPLAKDGDIIAFSSVEPGLDVSHCGLITVEDGRARLNHASEKYAMVMVGQDLDYYLVNRTKVDGFFVYRPRFD
jgi:hypothetical protein